MKIKKTVSAVMLMFMTFLFLLPLVAMAEEGEKEPVVTENETSPSPAVSASPTSDPNWDHMEKFYAQAIEVTRDVYNKGLMIITIIFAVGGIAVPLIIHKSGDSMKEEILAQQKKLKRMEENISILLKEHNEEIEQQIDKKMEMNRTDFNKELAGIHYFLGRLMYDENMMGTSIKKHDEFFKIINLLPKTESQKFSKYYRNALDDVKGVLKNKKLFATMLFKDTNIKENLNKAHNDLRLFADEDWFDEIKEVAKEIELAEIYSKQHTNIED